MHTVVRVILQGPAQFSDSRTARKEDNQMVHIQATVGTEPREWNLVFSLFETPRRTFPEMAGLPAHAAGRLMMLADRQNRTTNRLEGERVAWAWGGVSTTVVE